MKLFNTRIGVSQGASIEKLIKSSILKLRGNKKFNFDWTLEIENDVYKIQLIEDDEILGLLSLIDYADEFRLHINLIESSIANRGRGKLYDNIPGCLIAFACQLSFKKGYEGFVSLEPKTARINYYIQKYGFEQLGYQMAVFYELSNSIIEKYLGHEKI